MSGKSNNQRLLELTHQAGVYPRKLQSKFNLYVLDPFNVSEDDITYAKQLLAEEASTGQSGKPLLRTKKRVEKYTFKNTTGALTRLVQENGPAGAAKYLLANGGSLESIKDSNSRTEQSRLRDGLIVAATKQGNLELVRTFAFNTGPQRLVDLLIIALNDRNAELAQVLLECGADPNYMSETFRSVAYSGDVFVLELFLRSPKGISGELINDPLLEVLASSDCHAEIVSLLVQAATPGQLRRQDALQYCVSNGRLDLLAVILYYTRTLPPTTLSGLLMAAAQALRLGMPIQHCMVEALLCAGASQLQDEAYEALLAFVQRGMIPSVKLMISFGTPVKVDAIRLALRAANPELLNELLPEGTWGPDKVSSCVDALPQYVDESIRQMLLGKLLRTGAVGRALDGELVRAVSLHQLGLVEELMRRGASPDAEDGRALILAIKTEHSTILKKLFEAEISSRVLEIVFSYVQRLSQIPRLRLTKVFLTRGVKGETVDRALRDAVCDHTGNRDEQLINMLSAAGGNECWNDAECLRDTIQHQNLPLFQRLLSNSHQIQSKLASILVKSTMEMDNEELRNQFLKELIYSGAAGDELARALCTILRSAKIDNALLDLIVLKGSVDANYDDGAIISISATLCTMQVLRKTLQFRNLIPETFSYVLMRVIRHDFPDDLERARRVSILLQAANQAHLATEALQTHINNCLVVRPAGHNWPSHTIKVLLEAGADINVRDGSSLVCATMAGAVQILEMLLRHQPTEASLDNAFQQAVDRSNLDTQSIACELLVAAGATKEAVSKGLTHACKQSNTTLLNLLLKLGADPNYAGGRCLTIAVSRNNTELLRILLDGQSIDNEILQKLWNEAAMIPVSAEKSFGLYELLLQAGVYGETVDNTLLRAVKGQNLPLCTLILKYDSNWSHFRSEFAELSRADASANTSDSPSPTPKSHHSIVSEALLEALKTKQEDICKLFLEHGATFPAEWESTIRVAIDANSISILEMVLESLPEDEARLASNFALSLAVHADMKSTCSYILERQSSSKFQEAHIMRAVTLKGDISLLRLFLNANPSQGVLKSAFAASTELDSLLQFETFSAVLGTGFRDEILNAYLSEILVRNIPPLELIILFLDNGASLGENIHLRLACVTASGNMELLKVLVPRAPHEEVVKFFESTMNPPTLDLKMLQTFEILLPYYTGNVLINQALVNVVQATGDDSRRVLLARDLVKRGADIDYGQGKALCCACKAGDINLIRCVLEGRPSRQTQMRAFLFLFLSEISETELLACMDAVMSAPVLSAPGGLPVLPSKFDSTSIFQEILLGQRNSPKVISRLLHYDYPFKMSYKGHSVIHWALSQKVQPIGGECLKILIKHIGRMEHEDFLAGQSCLLLALENGRYDIIPVLIEQGAPTTTANAKGELPLMLASRKGSIQAVQSLLQAAATKNDGSLHEAVRELRLEVSKLLLSNGYDVDHASPLHGHRTVLGELCLKTSVTKDLEMSRRCQILIRILLNAGADPMFEVCGKKPIFLALDHANPVLITNILLSVYSTQNLDLNSFFYIDKGFCYSPTSYVSKSLFLGASGQQTALIELLEKHGIQQVFYALEGPQPDDAVGVPLSIEIAENERKLREERLSKDCSVCTERPTDPMEVHGPLTLECTHAWEITICTSCLNQCMASKTSPRDGFVPDNVTCWAPSCVAVLTHNHIQQYTTQEAFETYDDRLCRQAIHVGQTYVECAHKPCKGGGWYETTNISYLNCEICHESTCIGCNMPYSSHAGKPCPLSEEAKRQKEEEEQKEEERKKLAEAEKRRLAAERKRLAAERKKQEEDSIAEVNRVSKKCPNTSCQAPIQKNEGCDHMTCTRCRHEYCWICMAPYEPIRRQGNSKHKRNCKYYA